MKILMFSRLYWPHGGGVEKHVQELVKVLMSRGHEITLVTEQYDPSLQLNEVVDGMSVFRIPYFALNSKRSLWTWIDAHSELIENADVIHIHDVFWWYWMARFQFLFKPVYVTFHGYEGSEPPTLKAVAVRRMSELMSRGSICVGEFMKKWYKASPTYLTYGAVHVKQNAKLSYLNDKTALFWGRFDTDTGIETYIEAARIGEGDISGLSVYGDGPLRATIVNEKIKGVKYFPWTREIETKIKSAQYAFVSRYLSILEAMVQGRLVVAVYNNEIKKDYLLCHPMRDNMIIVNTAKELVQRLKKLSPADERHMVKTAYEWAQQQSWKSMADLYEELWGI